MEQNPISHSGDLRTTPSCGVFSHVRIAGAIRVSRGSIRFIIWLGCIRSLGVETKEAILRAVKEGLATRFPELRGSGTNANVSPSTFRPLVGAVPEVDQAEQKVKDSALRQAQWSVINGAFLGGILDGRRGSADRTHLQPMLQRPRIQFSLPNERVLTSDNIAARLY